MLIYCICVLFLLHFCCVCLVFPLHSPPSVQLFLLPGPRTTLDELAFILRIDGVDRPCTVDDLTYKSRNPLLEAEVPQAEVLQAEAAVRIQAQARRKQAADRVAGLKAQLAQQEAVRRDAVVDDAGADYARVLVAEALTAALQRLPAPAHTPRASRASGVDAGMESEDVCSEWRGGAVEGALLDAFGSCYWAPASEGGAGASD